MADSVLEKKGYVAESGGVLSVPLLSEIERVKRELKTGDRSTASLVRDQGLNVAAMALRAGAMLEEHHAKGPITVQVIEGRVKVAAQGKDHELAAGGLIAMARGVPHSVTALADSVLLLTVADN